MEVSRVLAFQHGEVGHDLHTDGQDLFVPAHSVGSDGDLVTLLYEGYVYDGGHAVRLYSIARVQSVHFAQYLAVVPLRDSVSVNCLVIRQQGRAASVSLKHCHDVRHIPAKIDGHPPEFLAYGVVHSFLHRSSRHRMTPLHSTGLSVGSPATKFSVAQVRSGYKNT